MSRQTNKIKKKINAIFTYVIGIGLFIVWPIVIVARFLYNKLWNFAHSEYAGNIAFWSMLIIIATNVIWCFIMFAVYRASQTTLLNVIAAQDQGAARAIGMTSNIINTVGNSMKRTGKNVANTEQYLPPPPNIQVIESRNTNVI